MDPPLDHSLAVYNLFVSTGMDCSHTKFFDLTSTSALTGGGLIVLGAVPKPIMSDSASADLRDGISLTLML